jgi:hypothetical protein
MLVAARLRHIAGTMLSYRRYLNVELRKEMDKELKASLPRGKRP